MLKAPKFWYIKKKSLYSQILYPFSILFRIGTRIHKIISIENKSPIPTICIGNIVVGGAGKTPVSMKICKLLQKAGYNPHFISKGYAGIIKNSLIVENWHSAISVGDEPILLSKIAKTWVGKNRVKSSYLAKNAGADCLILDDGFQNPSISKNISIVVIDGEQEFGNNKVMPAGPLRESVRRGLSRANAVIIIGKQSDQLKQRIPNTIPVFKANFEIDKNNEIFKGKNITAFAGIAYPDKFFTTLELQGAKIVKKVSFPDHHIYTENDLLDLVETTNKTKSILVTTQKDFIRIPKSYRPLVKTLNGEISFEDEEVLVEIISNILENFYVNDNSINNEKY
ncbi:MAG: Tetraacyldisaccharide 4'-kinase [Alphaproteobacteria bacterium MarineAlpha5_Bin9]|nr:MAG: Tetraacyldisaccharide 4'-kinase [Alphaproteobacteria bacterium MarineAlpha5_Bin9]|tara:strand:+ start:9656 stop:10672 length:1017 start_codon:yes stop_codon:yes gene_type:complete